jgi:hypothetical protein
MQWQTIAEANVRSNGSTNQGSFVPAKFSCHHFALANGAIAIS